MWSCSSSPAPRLAVASSVSLNAKTSARCGEHSTDGVVLETIPYIETLTTELSNKIWQKIPLLPRT